MDRLTAEVNNDNVDDELNDLHGREVFLPLIEECLSETCVNIVQRIHTHILAPPAVAK